MNVDWKQRAISRLAARAGVLSLLTAVCWNAAVGSGTTCAADLPTEVLNRLTPPNRVPVPELPAVTGPTATSTSRDTLGVAPLATKKKPSKQPLHTTSSWSLPVVALPRDSAPSPLELKKPLWRQPTIDPPALASEVAPTGPRPIVLWETQRSFVYTSTPPGPPSGDRFVREPETLPKPNDDPAALARFGYLVRPQAVASAAPPALLRLTVPDPDSALRAVRIEGVAPGEGDALSVPRVAPDRPVLPAK